MIAFFLFACTTCRADCFPRNNLPVEQRICWSIACVTRQDRPWCIKSIQYWRPVTCRLFCVENFPAQTGLKIPGSGRVLCKKYLLSSQGKKRYYFSSAINVTNIEVLLQKNRRMVFCWKNKIFPGILLAALNKKFVKETEKRESESKCKNRRKRPHYELLLSDQVDDRRWIRGVAFYW